MSWYKGVSGTDPSPSVRIPWFLPVDMYCMAYHNSLPGADDSRRQGVADGAQPDVDVAAKFPDTLLKISPGKIKQF
jgi:hypothetical protein